MMLLPHCYSNQGSITTSGDVGVELARFSFDCMRFPWGIQISLPKVRNAKRGGADGDVRENRLQEVTEQFNITLIHLVEFDLTLKISCLVPLVSPNKRWEVVKVQTTPVNLWKIGKLFSFKPSQALFFTTFYNILKTRINFVSNFTLEPFTTFMLVLLSADKQYSNASSPLLPISTLFSLLHGLTFNLDSFFPFLNF